MNKRAALIFAAGVVLGGAVVALAGLGSSWTEMSASVPTAEKTMPALLPPSTAPAVPASVSSVEAPLFHAFLSTAPDAYSETYEVKKGDSLAAIAKARRTTAELLRRINQLTSDRLSIRQRLKVPKVPFSLVVDKSQNTLILKAGEDVLKTYAVSTGSDNSTPAGVFKVTHKLVNPTWYKSGAVVPYGSPENVLGTRWIGLDRKGYGIHGTSEPEKLGQQVTAGCVRMRNEEVEEIFGFVLPGTEVTIVD